MTITGHWSKTLKRKILFNQSEIIFLKLPLLLLLSILSYPATGCSTIASENFAEIEDGFGRKSQFWFKTFESVTLQNVNTIKFIINMHNQV